MNPILEKATQQRVNAQMKLSTGEIVTFISAEEKDNDRLEVRVKFLEPATFRPEFSPGFFMYVRLSAIVWVIELA